MLTLPGLIENRHRGDALLRDFRFVIVQRKGNAEAIWKRGRHGRRLYTQTEALATVLREEMLRKAAMRTQPTVALKGGLQP